MKNAKASLLMTLMVVSAFALTFAASDKSGAVTGDDLVRALSQAASKAGATDVSKQLLEISLGKNGGAPLTEAAAVALLNRAGFAATTSNPNRLVTSERAAIIVREFSAALTLPAAGAGNGIGKAGLPEGVEVCLQAPNHGQCVGCCKGIGGGASSCAKVCMEINKPSASEPLP